VVGETQDRGLASAAGPRVAGVLIQVIHSGFHAHHEEDERCLSE